MISSKTLSLAAVILISFILIIILYHNLFQNIQIIFFIFLVVLICTLLLLLVKKRVSSQRKIDETTVFLKPKKLLGKLILPNNEDYILNDYERTFGREDFLGFTDTENLSYIGKKHFKLTRLDDGFYIQDLNTKNGTKVNGEDIRGLGKIKLRNGDEITMARVKIYYWEEILTERHDS